MKPETQSGKTYSKKVQHLLFPDPNYCTERDMFFRLGNNTHHSENSIVFDESHTTVWFNTYFNSFSIVKWAKFANIRGVSLTLRLKGKFIVTIIREEDIMGNRTSDMVAEQTLSCDTQKEFNISLNSVHTTGVYFFILHAIEANSVYYGGYYSVLPSAEPKHIKLGISICHFKKEPYIRTNMAAIARYLKDFPELKNKIEVFISDNGNTLTKSDAPYDFVNIFPNKNVGGAGGFTRCIMEIQKANSAGNNITHALLMDDDLTFNPEIFYRTQALLSLLKPKYDRYFFSGTMNRLDRKNIQHENGALWNGGVFACRLSYLAQHLHKNLNCSSFLDVMTQYDQLESTSFDYAVVEHETCIGMLPYHGYWRDLGTWNTLTGEMKDASMGRAILGEGAENTFVVNELSTPIVALGTKNLIIAASPDGILVSDLGKSSYMKPYVEHLGDTPMFEERRWGEYRIVEHTRQDDAETITKQALIHCDKTISFEHGISHKKIWVLTMGRANIEIDGVCHCACAGDSFQIAPFQKHSLHALTEVSLLSVEFMESD